MKTQTHEHPCAFDYQTKKKEPFFSCFFLIDASKYAMNRLSICRLPYHVVPLFHSRFNEIGFFHYFFLIRHIRCCCICQSYMVGMTLNYTEKHQIVLVFLFSRLFSTYIWHRLSYERKQKQEKKKLFGLIYR